MVSEGAEMETAPILRPVDLNALQGREAGEGGEGAVSFGRIRGNCGGETRGNCATQEGKGPGTNKPGCTVVRHVFFAFFLLRSPCLVHPSSGFVPQKKRWCACCAGNSV